MGTAVRIGTELNRGEQEGECKHDHYHYQPQLGEMNGSDIYTPRRTALGLRSEITRQEPLREEDDKNYLYYLHGEKSRSSSSGLTMTKTVGAMCNGWVDDVSADAVVAAPAEEWSPIRESPLPMPLLPHQRTFDRFPADEPGSSSDMDTREDPIPLLRGPREGAAVNGLARAFAPHSNADFVAIASSGGTLDGSGGCSFAPATAGGLASKRKRVTELAWHPTVEVTFEGLTRESKTALQQALQSWSYWHSRSYSAGMEPTEENLQSGTEVYSPALALEPTLDAGTITVWMDKPLKKQKLKIQTSEDGVAVDKERQNQKRQEKESQDKEMDVPLYDRACISALTSQDIENPDRFVYAEPQEGLRCFNCGSYSHSLRSCPRPHSATAIRNARDTALNKRGPRPRIPSRYYQCSPGGKFDDLKPGVLSLEARKAIGIGEFDPPPWLHRMREIGYPPGYLEDAEEESSGIQFIIDDTQAAAGKDISRDGNAVENRIPVEEPEAGQKMTVDYPGINAPIPEKAELRSWASPPKIQPVESRGSKRPYHQMHNSGSGLLSPQSPWAGGMGDIDLRDEGYVRNKFRGHVGSYSRNRFDEMEAQIDVYGSNLYHATSPVVNMNGNLLVDSPSHWSKLRVSASNSLAADGTNYLDARSGTQTYHHHIPSSPSGLASPLRGIFQTPGAAGPITSTSHIYSRHNYYHSQGPLPNSQSQSQTANPSWLKAQSALDAMQPSRISAGLPPSPRRVPKGDLQSYRDSRMQHHWGRR